MSKQTMKAVRLRAFGGPEIFRYEDVLKLEVKPGDVLVRVRAVDVNPPLNSRRVSDGRPYRFGECRRDEFADDPCGGGAAFGLMEHFVVGFTDRETASALALTARIAVRWPRLIPKETLHSLIDLR